MSYSYRNHARETSDVDQETPIPQCSQRYPHTTNMIPSRPDEYYGQYAVNGYQQPSVGYSLVTRPYVWTDEHGMMVQRHMEPSHRLNGDYGLRGDLQDVESRSRKRRLPSVAQRCAANVRERRRMFNLNEAFDSLRRRVPTFAYEKRLSRIETLRLAIAYIAFMSDILKGKNPGDIKLNMQRSNPATAFRDRRESSVDRTSSPDTATYSEYEYAEDE